MEIVKLIIRSILIALAVVIVTICYAGVFVFTGINQFVDWVFCRHNYWNIGNEWFQYVEAMEGWYKLWKGDWKDW